MEQTCRPAFLELQADSVTPSLMQGAEQFFLLFYFVGVDRDQFYENAFIQEPHESRR